MLPEDVATELVSNVQSVAENQRPRHTEVEVSGRVCESDKNEGVEVSLTGPHVRLRPIVELIAGLDDWKIETLNMVPDADKGECHNCGEEVYEKSISMFCAYVGNDPRQSADLADVFA